jgi:Tol biopolymer transport system component
MPHSNGPPSGEWLAYDSDVVDFQYDVYVITGQRRLTAAVTSERSSDYGRPGRGMVRWLYFASDRTGKEQIYKMPSAGGVAVQVTKGGGFPPAVESADGNFLY